MNKDKVWVTIDGLVDALERIRPGDRTSNEVRAAVVGAVDAAVDAHFEHTHNAHDRRLLANLGVCLGGLIGAGLTDEDIGRLCTLIVQKIRARKALNEASRGAE